MVSKRSPCTAFLHTPGALVSLSAMASPQRVWLGAVLLLGAACGAVHASKAGPGEPRRIVVVPALICVGVRRQTSFALVIPAARLLPPQEPPAGAP